MYPDIKLANTAQPYLQQICFSNIFAAVRDQFFLADNILVMTCLIQHPISLWIRRTLMHEKSCLVPFWFVRFFDFRSSMTVYGNKPF